MSDTRVRAADPRIHVADSGVHGKGVFTSAPVARGEALFTCRGIETPAADVAEGARAMQIAPGLFLVEDAESPSVDDFMNHSCEPNIGFLRGTLTVHSLRDIDAGEELVIDYSTTMNEPGWAVPCSCGSARCRGVVRSFCDLSPEDRARLRPIALAYLRG